jgi:hypothetical protein
MANTRVGAIALWRLALHCIISHWQNAHHEPAGLCHGPALRSGTAPWGKRRLAHAGRCGHEGLWRAAPPVRAWPPTPPCSAGKTVRSTDVSARQRAGAPGGVDTVLPLTLEERWLRVVRQHHLRGWSRCHRSRRGRRLNPPLVLRVMVLAHHAQALAVEHRGMLAAQCAVVLVGDARDVATPPMLSLPEGVQLSV